MQLAMIGLGRMGANMLRRLMGDGHACVGHDPQAESVAALVVEGATGDRQNGDRSIFPSDGFRPTGK